MYFPQKSCVKSEVVARRRLVMFCCLYRIRYWDNIVVLDVKDGVLSSAKSPTRKLLIIAENCGVV